MSREHDSACGGVLRATVGLRGSAACWLGRLRFWPRPSDGLDTTEGLLGPGSGMTMCADLDSAPRPPTLTKDATLACAVVKMYRIYAHKVWVDHGIWTYTITMEKWYTFENVRRWCSSVKVVGVATCQSRQRTEGSWQTHPWWLCWSAKIEQKWCSLQEVVTNMSLYRNTINQIQQIWWEVCSEDRSGLPKTPTHRIRAPPQHQTYNRMHSTIGCLRNHLKLFYSDCILLIWDTTV